MPLIKTKDFIKYYIILQALGTAFILYLNLKIITIKGSLILDSKAPNKGSFHLDVPTLTNGNIFFNSQHNFTVVVTWGELIREPYLIISMLLTALSYILFFLQLYFLYKILEKIDKGDFEIEKLVRASLMVIVLIFFSEKYFFIFENECKNIFLQKHIYIEGASLVHSSLSSSPDFTFTTIFALIIILDRVYKKKLND